MLYQNFIKMQVNFKCYVLLTFCVVISVGRQQFRCDYKYSADAQGWLKLHEIPANFNEARLRCQLEGAVLASPLNKGLGAAMASLMKESFRESDFYTGIHATFSKGDYFSIEGVPLFKIPHNWAPKEPDNFNNEESCLTMSSKETLADVKCSNVYPYICYKQKSNMSITECGTTDTAYKLDARTGSCYKFHTVPRTWSRAFMACTAEGGYLTIINSETEAIVIKELFAKYPHNSILGMLWKDVAFIGFHGWNANGDWRTLHNEPLHEAGYNMFEPNEPNNATTGEYCGAVYRSGLLDDLWCENSYAFICEKNRKSLVCEDEQ